MYIYLIRHAESYPVNLEKVWQGVRNNANLTPIGYGQANNIISLIDMPITKIFSSPMNRALQTAKPLSAYTKIPIVVSSSLLEIDIGSFENLTTTEINKRYPKELQQLDAYLDLNFSFPNGESFSNIAERVTNFANVISKSDENIAVFSHNYVLQVLIATLTGESTSRIQNNKLQNAAVNRLYMKNKEIKIDYLNKTSNGPQ